MEVILKWWGRLLTFVPTIRPINIIEILIITVLIYYILIWIRDSRAWTLLKGIFVIFAFVLVAYFFKMTTILWLFQNLISVIIISTALQIPSAIFTESYLSFLGLGVNAPMPSLGSLASDALNGITSYPYRLVIPAVTISLIVLSLNLFGDGLRDAFDPKLKN